MVTRKSDSDQSDQSEDDFIEEEGHRVSYAARLIRQGKHRFYLLTLPSDVLAETCMVEPRNENPIEGFQRRLDPKRAQEIADYIDAGFGTIPTSVVLSAQAEADMRYSSKTQVLSFNRISRAFLILDGQHRIFGFQKAKTKIRTPVVVYKDLSRSEEARLFVDINTKQRPVPNELLLDIRRLANDERDDLALMHDIFDLLAESPSSPLLGQMSPSERSKGKISRVTFNAALASIKNKLGEADADYVYSVLSPYLHAWLGVLRDNDAASNITNATLFRAIILLFPRLADRVEQKYDEFTQDNFEEAMRPMLEKAKHVRQKLQKPGKNPTALHDFFKEALEDSFSLRARKG